MKKSAAIVFVIAIAFVFPLFFSGQDVSPLPQTPAGRSVAEYLKAFNAGEAAMREFFTSRTAAESLKRTPIEIRLERWRQMKERLGNLELRKVLEAKADLVSILAHGSNGPVVQMDFEFEPAEPYGLLGIRVMNQGEENAPADPKPDDESIVAAVKDQVHELAGRDAFSGVVLIVHGDKTIFQTAVGLADREKNVSNRIDTKFNVGSINKSFTETAVRILTAEGKISLDDTIGKYLPDYPNREAAAKVTVRHLLNMTSGIGDFFGERYQKTPKEKIRGLADYLPLFADQPLAFEPGSRNLYSNGGFIVLGLIVSKASGMDYYDFIRERIYKPAGMTDSGSFAKDEAVANRAVGYTKSGTGWVSNYDTLPGRGSSAGGGYSTAADLLKYVIAQKTGKLGAAAGGEMRGGFGIAGGAPGLNAAVEWESRREYTIIVLSNLDPPSAMTLARKIRSWLPRK